jgi:hypothetical protein
MSERRDNNSGRPSRGAGPRGAGASRGGGFSRGPRRDDDRPSRGPRPMVTVLHAVVLTVMIVRVVMMTVRVALIVMTAHSWSAS